MHISEVADTYVKDINEYFLKRQSKSKVLSVSGDGKIGLSIRRALQEEEKRSPAKRCFPEKLPSYRSRRYVF